MVYYTVSSYNEDMFLVGILNWWYGDGLRQRIQIHQARIAKTSDFFSIELLLATLFSPFRQISAGSVRGSLGTQLRAVADKLISRCIGAIVRIFMLVTGAMVILAQTIIAGIVTVFWLLVPLLPIIGLILMAIGWVPSW